ncbi:MAG TPA: hypothetical protein VFL86_00050 [Burkholderiaceae bacterium]|nr:hypothetical protein [Burkholderiaceae bacterium]
MAARESFDALRRRDLRRLGGSFSLEWLRDVGPEANTLFIPYYQPAT